MNNIPSIVDIVLYFLAGLSVLTWTILIVKCYLFWRQKQANAKLLNSYAGVTRLNGFSGPRKCHLFHVKLVTVETGQFCFAQTRPADFLAVG